MMFNTCFFCFFCVFFFCVFFFLFFCFCFVCVFLVFLGSRVHIILTDPASNL